MRNRQKTATALILPALLAIAAPLAGQNLHVETVTSGLSQPLFVTSPPGDNNRLFIVEKTGSIRIFDRQQNKLLTDPYLSVPVATDSERGLLGLAFDPNFATTGRFYVDYARTGSGGQLGDLVVARYTASGDPLTSNTANTTGESLLTIEHSLNGNHNGGWVGFRPTDPGRLYIAVGDGGSGNDPPNNAQNTNVLLGKMLRIDVSGATGYTSPSDNLAGGLPEIYQYGLRNPWRDSFDRQTGDLWIGDVGQDAVEEIDFQAAGTPGGQNFGWRSKEGNQVTNLNGPGPFTGLTDPIYTYTHGTGRSITGGYVYRGPNTALQGTYLYGDYISGRSWTLKYDGTTVTGPVERTNQLDPDGSGPLTMANELASFGEDAAGELYMIAIGRGTLYHIVPDAVGTATVKGRHIFYNNSRFDGNAVVGDARDDAAIAPDKVALLPGGTASLSNYTSFSKGINGISIDLAGTHGTLTPDDFAFKVGNNNSTSAWTALAALPEIVVRPGAGADGSDRVELIWPDGAVTGQWLQVTLKANTDTGLGTPDVFYFGNAIGESGNQVSNGLVNAADEIAARNDPHTLLNPASITNLHDYNRDTFVNAADQIIARNHTTTVSTALRLILVPVAAPVAAAVPEPSSWVLAGMGLVLLIGPLRRRGGRGIF